MKRALLAAVVGLNAVVVYACVESDPPGTSPGPSTNEPDATNGASGGNGTSSGGASGSVPDASCSTPATCNAGELVRCGATVETCSLGCVDESGGSRCRSFDPSGAPRSSELRLDGLEDLTLNDDLVFDTDTGAVERIGADGQRSPLREANPTDAPAVIAGIGYRRYADRGMFFFKTFAVDAGVGRNFKGALPLALVARTVNVRGRWFLPCGRLGGGTMLAPGSGAGQAGQPVVAGEPRTGGGGGAGHAVGGGLAMFTAGVAPGTAGAGGTPGPAYGGLPFDPLVGGSLGGPTSTTGVEAGRGGAALQLVGLDEIVIGGTAPASGIAAGGCGGKTPQEYGGGAGGGSGGTLLLEAPRITLQPGAFLAANGGAGGASAIPEVLESPSFDNEPAGTADPHLGTGDGALSASAAGTAPTNSGDYYYGGRGGSTSTPASTDLKATPNTYWARLSERGRASGGGGGGSHGYIHFFTRDGNLVIANPASVGSSPSAAPFYAVGQLVQE